MRIPGFLETFLGCEMGDEKGYSVGEQLGSAGPCCSETRLAGRRLLILLLAPVPAGLAGGPGGVMAPVG